MHVHQKGLQRELAHIFPCDGGLIVACSVPLQCNAGEVLRDLELLQRAASASVEFRERLAQLGELRADELCVDVDDVPAAGAPSARIRLQLPQRFRELVATVARDGHVRVD
jgi:hypothetical protein